MAPIQRPKHAHQLTAARRRIASDFSVRAFVNLCLRENHRRFATYALELLRPRTVPTVARAVLTLSALGA